MRWNRTFIGVVTVIAMLGTGFAAGLSLAQPEGAEEPRVDRNEWRGFLSCSVSFPTAPFPARCPEIVDANRDDRHAFETEPDLRTIVFAMVWEPSPMNTEEDLPNWLWSDEAGGHVVRAKGPSPLEARYDLDEGSSPQGFIFRVASGSGSLAEETSSPIPINLGLAVQQEFTVYWDLYYEEPAPGDASALPV